MTTAELYPIGEVARLTSVPIKTIRYYADLGLLPPSATTEARYRLFSATDIWRLELIRTLRLFGFALGDIGELLTGSVSIAQAIDVQLAAVGSEIARLQQVQHMLSQARAHAADGPESLGQLRHLGAAMHEDVAIRRKLLVERFAHILRADPELRPNPLVDYLARQLPEAMTAEQSQLWTEVVALINEPSFAAALQAQHAPFGTSAPMAEAEQSRWNQAMMDVVERAVAAHEQGLAPDSQTVQALATEWLGFFAAARGVPNDQSFAEWFVAEAPRLMPDAIERFWTLMGELLGRPAAATHFDAQRLLLAAVKLRTV